MRAGLAGAVAVLCAGCSDGPDVVAGGERTTDTGRGEILSYACQACHTLGEGQDHQIGPNLFEVFGRTAGSSPGFDYSIALGESGIVWSESELDAWLADPAGYLPGTTMAFTGYRDASDRSALIDYLVSATSR
jgi:cytochrome c2